MAPGVYRARDSSSLPNLEKRSHKEGISTSRAAKIVVCVLLMEKCAFYKFYVVAPPVLTREARCILLHHYVAQ